MTVAQTLAVIGILATFGAIWVLFQMRPKMIDHDFPEHQDPPEESE